jgi:hypothetical protein
MSNSYAVHKKVAFRIGLRLGNQRMAQTVMAFNVDEAIALVRNGAWAAASVASVSAKK